MTEHNMDHMSHLEEVAASDVAELRRKELTYAGSWKRRGGVGAFMMLCRKWDRIEGTMRADNVNYDIFSAIQLTGGSGADGTVLAEVRDLRRYLLLVEAEMVARGVVSGREPRAADPERVPFFESRELSQEDQRRLHQMYPGSPEDGGHHEPSPRTREGTLRGLARQLSTAAADLDAGVRDAAGDLDAGVPSDAGRREPEDWSVRHEPPVSAEAERRVPRHAHAPNPRPPGRPAAHIGEGEPRDGIPDTDPYPPWPVIGVEDPRSHATYWNVDRAHATLPRPEMLFPEQNDKEHSLLRACYRGMYLWSPEREKWLLRPEFVAHWGRRT